MIPYPASSTVVTQRGKRPQLELECPVCHTKLREDVDNFGEQTSFNYQDHFASEHPEA